MLDGNALYQLVLGTCQCVVMKSRNSSQSHKQNRNQHLPFPLFFFNPSPHPPHPQLSLLPPLSFLPLPHPQLSLPLLPLPLLSLPVEYDVDQADAGEITPRWPGLQGSLYESQFQSQFFMVTSPSSFSVMPYHILLASSPPPLFLKRIFYFYISLS